MGQGSNNNSSTPGVGLPCVYLGILQAKQYNHTVDSCIKRNATNTPAAPSLQADPQTLEHNRTTTHPPTHSSLLLTCDKV